MKEINLLGTIIDKECLEYGETCECLNQQSNVCVTCQARAIRKNGWLSELGLEGVKRQLEADNPRMSFGLGKMPL